MEPHTPPDLSRNSCCVRVQCSFLLVIRQRLPHGRNTRWECRRDSSPSIYRRVSGGRFFCCVTQSVVEKHSYSSATSEDTMRDTLTRLIEWRAKARLKTHTNLSIAGSANIRYRKLRM